MGCCTSTYVPKALVLDADYENYKGAGVCFKNETHILAGVQTIKKEKKISGIGGKREKSDESYYHTAFREMIEELFETKATKQAIEMCYCFEPIKIEYFKENNYVMLFYDFKQLNQMLILLKKIKLQTYAYKTFPTSIEMLLFERLKMNSEITNICLLPLETTKYDQWFINDIGYIKEKKL
jgi:hypothetical protein